MNKETCETLKRVVGETRMLLGEKYGQRKRLTKDEVWRRATLIRDITEVENWIKEYKEIKEMVEVGLKEIIKGEGTYSRDQLTHANNTIEYAKLIATKTLEVVEKL